jgi:hypothetical protein
MEDDLPPTQWADKHPKLARLFASSLSILKPIFGRILRRQINVYKIFHNSEVLKDMRPRVLRAGISRLFSLGSAGRQFVLAQL